MFFFCSLHRNADESLADDDDDEVANVMNKRQQFDDYGHMRFGKRQRYDDYGHLRFGRNHRE